MDLPGEPQASPALPQAGWGVLGRGPAQLAGKPAAHKHPAFHAQDTLHSAALLLVLLLSGLSKTNTLPRHLTSVSPACARLYTKPAHPAPTCSFCTVTCCRGSGRYIPVSSPSRYSSAGPSRAAAMSGGRGAPAAVAAACCEAAVELLNARIPGHCWWAAAAAGRQWRVVLWRGCCCCQQELLRLSAWTHDASCWRSPTPAEPNASNLSTCARCLHLFKHDPTTLYHCCCCCWWVEQIADATIVG